MRINNMIEFEEYGYHNGNSFYYFIAPKEQLDALGLSYEDADICTIYLEHPFADKSIVSTRVSPTKYDENEDMYVDYDWNDIQLEDDEIKRLLAIASERTL